MTAIENLHGKKILILGFGKEGRSSLEFVKKNINYKKIGIADSQKQSDAPLELTTHFGKSCLSSIRNYDVVIKSPGIPYFEVKKNSSKNQIITSQSGIFLSNCKGKVIGITGTKGKSTTTKIIAEIIEKEKMKVATIGNIGVPALDYLKKDNQNYYFVYELSSFQLQTVEKSPLIAVMLNIFTDHLDKHKNFTEYVSAKANITKFQTKEDFLIYNEKDKLLREIASKSKAKKIPFIPQKSKYNITTPVEPIIEICKILKIKKEKAFSVIEKYSNLPHRTEYLGQFKGIYFYNDSSATIPEATIAAINNIENVETIIIGGSDKGSDVSKLAKKIKQSQIKNIVLLKGSPKKLEKEIFSLDKNVYVASSMEEAVEVCYQKTTKNNSCLLSPGFASFNMFKNLYERGDIFRKLVKEKNE